MQPRNRSDDFIPTTDSVLPPCSLHSLLRTRIIFSCWALSTNPSYRTNRLGRVDSTSLLRLSQKKDPILTIITDLILFPLKTPVAFWDGVVILFPDLIRIRSGFDSPWTHQPPQQRQQQSQHHHQTPAWMGCCA